VTEVTKLVKKKKFAVTSSFIAMEARREELGARLDLRKEERDAAARERISSDHIVLEDQVEQFHRELGERVEEVEELINKCGGEGVSEQLDNIARQLVLVQKYVTDSSIFLPSYDLKKGQRIVDKLQTSFQATQGRVQPKKKFGFKGAKNRSKAADSVKPVEKVLASISLEDKPKMEEKNSFTLKDKKGEVLTIEGAEVAGRDLNISSLRDCRVQIRGGPSTLHLTDVKNCRLLFGPVATSVFIEGCEDSLIAVSCQQLRTHSARHCSIYLHTTSRAIIEDCSQLEFAPYTWAYPGIEDDYQATGLDRKINNWKEVGDFNWLATDTPSPNWSVLPEDRREDLSSLPTVIN